jgi:hypothetical protein
VNTEVKRCGKVPELAQQCGCGTVFYAADRDQCFECVLAEADRQRVEAGPTPHNGRRGISIVLESDLVVRGPRWTSRPYSVRIEEWLCARSGYGEM